MGFGWAGTVGDVCSGFLAGFGGVAWAADGLQVGFVVVVVAGYVVYLGGGGEAGWSGYLAEVTVASEYASSEVVPVWW